MWNLRTGLHSSQNARVSKVRRVRQERKAHLARAADLVAKALKVLLAPRDPQVQMEARVRKGPMVPRVALALLGLKENRVRQVLPVLMDLLVQMALLDMLVILVCQASPALLDL